MLVNNTLIGSVSVTGGTLGAAVDYGSLAVGGTSGPAVVTPGATPSDGRPN